MSHAEGSSPIKSSGNVGFQVAAATGSWREGVIVLVMVLAPIGLAAILVAIGLSVIAIWQIVHGTPVNLPTPTNTRLYGFLSYAVASWIAVAVVWLWSSRRGLSGSVFLFRRLTWPALTAGFAGFVIAMFGVPILTHWLSSVMADRSQVFRIDVHDPQSVAILVILFVVTAPVSEEVLYRGLFDRGQPDLRSQSYYPGRLRLGHSHGRLGRDIVRPALAVRIPHSRLAGSRSI